MINERLAWSVLECELIAWDGGDDHSLLTRLMNKPMRPWLPMRIGDPQPNPLRLYISLIMAQIYGMPARMLEP
jgi:hypothetical protein